MNKITVKELVEMAIFIALAIVLDRFSIKLGSTGGSINFSMLPLIILALRHGPLKCFIASGIVYGLCTNLIDGYGINTYPFDYLIAFGSISLVGFCAKYIYNHYEDSTKAKINSALMIFLAILGFFLIRVLSSSIDSVLFYELTYIDGIIYNSIYVLFSAIIDLVLTILLLKVIVTINKIYPTNYLKKIKFQENDEKIDLK